MSGTHQLGAAQRELDNSRRALTVAWNASTPAWSDTKRDAMDRENVQPLLTEIARYAEQLAATADLAAAALQHL